MCTQVSGNLILTLTEIFLKNKTDEADLQSQREIK